MWTARPHTVFNTKCWIHQQKHVHINTQDINLFLLYLSKIWKIKKEENSICMCVDLKTEKVIRLNYYKGTILHDKKRQLQHFPVSGAAKSPTLLSKAHHRSRGVTWGVAWSSLISVGIENILTAALVNKFQLLLFQVWVCISLPFQLQKASYFQL